MKKTFSCAALLILVSAFSQPVLAAEYNLKMDLGVRGVDEDTNSAKFEEYGEVKDAFGNIDVYTFRNKYYLGVEGKNIGYDDESYEVYGGQYGISKYKAYYNEIEHNLSYGARTFYTGAGTGTLSYTFANNVPGAAYVPTVPTNANSWNGFDYTVQRKDFGYELQVQLPTSFYLRAGADKLFKDGIKPIAGASGVFADRTGVQFSGFGNMVEMPEPVNYETINSFLEFGYTSETMHAKLTGSLSNFDNSTEYLTWRNPYVTSQTLNEVTSLPPDNEYYKIVGEVSWKKLPLHSILATELSYSVLKNDFTVRNTLPDSTSGGVGTSPTYHTDTITLNSAGYDGDVSYKKFGLRLASMPAQDLHSTLFFSYLDKNNDSTRMSFTSGGTTTTAALFGYDKTNAGLELAYKLPMQTKISGGYEYLDIDRDEERDDATSTTDHTFSLHLKNTTLDYLTAKLGYRHVATSSDFANGNKGTVATDAEYIERFVRRFDATDKKRNAVDLGIDIYPADFVDLALEYTYENNDYDETILGRTEDTSHSVYVDALLRLPNKITLSAYGGFELTENDSFHRNHTGGTNSADPAAGSVAGSYNWNAELDDDFWSFGLKATMPLMDDKLKLVAAWDYQESDGEVNLSRPDGTNIPDIEYSDDYEKKQFDLQAIYALNTNVDITAGFLYEEYEYDDLQFMSYQNVIPATPNTFLTGAYADHDYDVNIGYLKLTYYLSR